MDTNNQKVKEILLREAYITSHDLARAEEYAKTHNASFIDYLIGQGLMSRELLGQAVAEAFGVTFANLTLKQPSAAQILKIPQETAKKYNVVLVEEQDGGGVILATDNPQRPGLAEEMSRLFPGQKITLTYGFPKDITICFVHYREPLITRLTGALKSLNAFAPGVIEEIIKEAVIERVSDIHFEPQEGAVIVRFRIDGILHTVGNIPRPLYENILNRIKVMSHLRIDEHHKPQDGAIRLTDIGGLDADLRVSIVPTLDGETTAIRILAQYIQGFTLKDIGLTESNQQIILKASKKPFGMILVTGPTGSGKTTTLYVILKLLNKPEINITTIEDPVEYKIKNINQIQVNPATDLTFASGLRSIIRQDPNIILVGEIRDLETAEIAVNAALTGHLLLTTFHANDASTAIPRLLDMGVEPFLMASTLELIVAQRLVRKVCSSCKYSQSFTKESLQQASPELASYINGELTIYRGKGCQSCNNSGYKGRIGLFELIKVTSLMKELILKHPPTEQIWQLAKKEGSKSMFEDGLEKIKSGETSLEEVLRVASPQ